MFLIVTRLKEHFESLNVQAVTHFWEVVTLFVPDRYFLFLLCPVSRRCNI